jgi:chaperonin GroES
MTISALEERWAKDKEETGPVLDDAYNEDGSLAVDSLDKTVRDRVPKPTGWRIVLLPYKGAEKSKGGILLSDQTREKQQITTVCAYVLAVGPLAYKDTVKFPEGAWCKEGDWIIFGRYAGARIGLDGGEVRIINDDEVLAVIGDPEDILHM